MNENQNNERDIDLRELFIALWKRKKMIICITLVFAIFAGVFSVFIISPVYDTKLNMVISMPETYNTRFGEYKLPITSNEQYISLITSNDVLINTIKDMEYNNEIISLEDLRKRIYIGEVDSKTGFEQNSFDITVSADNPEESLKLAETLYNNYTEFMDVMTKERAVNFYFNDFSVQIKSLGNSLNSTKEILKKNEELLAQTARTIANGETNLEIQTHLTETTDYVVPVNNINPNYIKIENDIVEKKQAVNTLEDAIRMNNIYLEELDKEKKAIAKYHETGRVDKLELSVIGVVETSVYLPSPPVAPSVKTSPSNSINVAIGIVIGGVIGIMFALAKEYWYKQD